MHGRKRTEYKNRFRDQQVAAGLAQKAQQWYALSHKALQLRHREDVDDTTAAAAPAPASLEKDTSDDDNAKTLVLLDKMLRVNPDPLHLWNHRRALLLLLLQPPPPSSAGDESSWVSTELALTAAALEKNPKAYGAWFHRKWVLQQQQQQQATAAAASYSAISYELGLTEQFLQRDERNFHCWNYRRFLVGLELELQQVSPAAISLDGSWKHVMHCTKTETPLPNATTKDPQKVVIGPQILALPPQQQQQDITLQLSPSTNNSASQPQSTAVYKILQREWDFTHTKIVENFSNFSAFHYRSKLLLLVDHVHGWSPVITSLDESKSNTAFDQLLETIAQQEWSLMENIMFTEPDDQTVWWYHRFLLDWVQEQQLRHVQKSSDQQKQKEEQLSWYGTWLQQQAETLQVLVEEDDSESGCKWGLLGYHLVLSRLVILPQPPSQQQQQQKEEWETKLEYLLDQLIQVDPDRKLRYETMRRIK